ncbi:NAD-P-binding protein [Mycena olivaceomarginata]|nr:NAD-P-binding protein [Mycena olivaceomarginata]
MPSSEEIVLVTGVTGFIASHIAKELLEDGFIVRGTARGDKFAELKSQAAVAKNPRFQAIEVKDIATDDLTDALKDVKYVIHTASPIAGRATPEEGLKAALQGTLNVLEQADKVGISKVVLTSSWATTMDPSLEKMFQGGVLTAKDWGTVSKEELLNGNNSPLWNYLATKILSESAAWDFAKAHPSIDLATVNPPFVYGPPAPGFLKLDVTRLGSNGMMYALIAGEPGRDFFPQMAPFYCDVRDVARAHDQKRFLLSGGTFTWKEAAEYLESARPDLKDRLPSMASATPLPGTLSTTDVSLAKNILGLDKYIPCRNA